MLGLFTQRATLHSPSLRSIRICQGSHPVARHISSVFPNNVKVATDGIQETQTSPAHPAAIGFWPRVDSDDSDESYNAPLKRKNTRNGKTDGGFRAIIRRFGKTFHKNYFLPSDQRELDRHDLQHQVRLEVLEGRLHLAPVVNPHRVLDIGTGSGIWAVEYANQNPRSNVLGIDLEPVLRRQVPPNCHFQVVDALKLWDFPHQFDYIHARSLGQFTREDQELFFNHILEGLAPGGWAEFQEWIVHFQTADHTEDGTALQKWNHELARGLEKIGKETYFIADYGPVDLRDAGFVNRIVRKYSVPNNEWPRGKHFKKIGSMMKWNCLEALDSLSFGIFIHVLQYSDEQLISLLRQVKEDIRNTEIHSFLSLVVVYCQKPFKASDA